MQQLSKNLFVENGLRGCNHGWVVTSDGIVLIDTPNLPSDALKLRAQLEGTGLPLRYILNTEPHGDHWTGNSFFDAPVVAHAGVRSRILATNVDQHIAWAGAMGPNEPGLLEGYRPKAPVITFDNELTLHVGNHTFRLIHHPGHTPYQAAVVVEEEGVVFTSDNVFCKVQTWLQEARPEQCYQALDALRALPQEQLVPGHGPLCGHDCLDEQEAFIREWVDYVRQAVGRGMTRQECVDNLPAFTDRYPMDAGQDGMSPRVQRLNAGNLYDYVTQQGIHQPA